MSFNGTEGAQITLREATEWTANYRNSDSGSVNAHFFGKDHITSILNQTGCKGIRMYHGIDSDGNPCLILVGVDADEKDLYNGYIAERGVSCPPYCGSGSPLQG
jgi:hypothetical protein